MGGLAVRVTVATLASSCSSPCAGLAGVDGDRVERGERIHPVLGDTDVDEVLDADARVDPIDGLTPGRCRSG